MPNVEAEALPATLDILINQPRFLSLGNNQARPWWPTATYFLKAAGYPATGAKPNAMTKN
jgi:hypothetical protein